MHPESEEVPSNLNDPSSTYLRSQRNTVYRPPDISPRPNGVTNINPRSHPEILTEYCLSTSGYIPLAPTGQRIPAQGETLGIGIRNRMRSEGTPHSA